MTQRVLIVKLPSLLRQIILDALEVDGRAEVVDCGDDDEDINLLEAIQQHEPDVIVTTLTDRGLHPAFEDFLSEETGRRVLSIERVGRSAYLFSMQPEPLSLGEMSTESLVKAIHNNFTRH